MIYLKSGKFNQIVSSPDNMKKFCQSAIDVSRQYNLDGLDIDWYEIWYQLILEQVSMIKKHW